MNSYVKHFNENFNEFLKFDTTRRHTLFETIQYSIIFAFLAFVSGFLIEKVFPEPDETQSTKYIIVQVLLQCILSAIAVYYIRLIGRFIPYIFEGNSTYDPHKIDEYRGEIMIALVFVGVQKNLLTKLEILYHRFSR